MNPTGHDIGSQSGTKKAAEGDDTLDSAVDRLIKEEEL